MDTVTVDTVTSMDVSANYSGEDVGSLFETIEKIEQDVGGANVYVPDEDLSLADLMGLIEEGGEASKVELGVAEVVVNATEVAEDNLNVKCESNEGASAENVVNNPNLKCESSVIVSSNSEVDNASAEDISPEVNDANDGVITINDSVDAMSATDTPNDGCELEDGASNGVKGSNAPTGATFSPVQTIPKDRLREIFKYANGIIY